MLVRGYDLAFVGGIHGAGKTFLSQAISKVLGAPHLSAGTLIARARATSTAKRVEDVQANQDTLIKGLEATPIEGPLLVLDGHFSLLGPTGEVQAVPLQTFGALAPGILLVAVAPPEVIAERLLRRDNVEWSLATLRDFQEHEVAAAADVSRCLGVPLHTVQSDLVGDAVEHVRAIVERR